jgi:hypothetical protein
MIVRSILSPINHNAKVLIPKTACPHHCKVTKSYESTPYFRKRWYNQLPDKPTEMDTSDSE